MTLRNLPQLLEPITFSQWSEEWMAGTPQYWTREARDSARAFLSRWVHPVLGPLLLTEISADHIHDVIRRWGDAGVGPNTIRSRYFTLKSVLSDARRARYLSRNPCSDVPVPPELKRSFFSWTQDLLSQQLAALSGSRIEDIALLILGSAMRPTELYAARLEDFNSATRALFVRYSAQYITARRTIILPNFACAALQRLSLKAAQKGTTLLLSMRHGKPCNLNYMSQQFTTSLRGRSAPTIRYRDWRGAFTYLANEGGVCSQTIDYYVKMRPRSAAPSLEQMHAAAEVLDRVYLLNAVDLQAPTGTGG